MQADLICSALPMAFYHWPSFPFCLKADKIFSLDCGTSQSDWLLYGYSLNKVRVSEFQRRLGIPIGVLNAWCIQDYHVFRLAGNLPALATVIAHEQGMDIAFVGELPHLDSPGLLLMDMDSTAIQIECIDEIAKLAGVGDEVSAVTTRAMCGELDFETSLHERVSKLQGVEVAILAQVRSRLPLTSGLTHLVRQLQALNWQVAIASGGFSYFADLLQKELCLVAAVANHLEIKDGKLTGQVVGQVVDAQYKATILQTLAEKLAIPLRQTVAIGDGANDLPMIQAAGLGIAYHAKDPVEAKASVAIRHADLTGVLCVLSSVLTE